MKWIATAGPFIDQFVASRSWIPKYRREVVNAIQSFHAFAVQNSDHRTSPLKLMRDWLMRHSTCSMLYRRNRARHIWRFLDFLVTHGALPRNPLHSLHRTYSLRGEGGVIDALSQTDWWRSLKNLRRPPRFASRFSGEIVDLIKLKRALGFRFITQERMLATFDWFTHRHPDGMTASIETLLALWIQSSSNPKVAYHRLPVGRALCAYMRRFDPQIRTLSFSRRLRLAVEQTQRVPCIVTTADMARILETARDLPSPRSPGRGETLRMMLLILFCAGLRIGESVRLRLGDFDSHERLLRIRETKFFKSRLVPLADSVCDEMFQYMEFRKSSGWDMSPEAALFCKPNGSGWRRTSMDRLFATIFRRSGFKPNRGRVGLRPHDLRHSFATGRVIQWYRDGVDVNARLPYLSTYLGHLNVASTQVYLSLTHDLLGEASRRFHHRYGSIVGKDSHE